MEFEVLIPITLFVCITYCVKLVVDARLRSKLLKDGGSADLLRSIVQGEEQQRRHASLRWGLTLIAIAIGFAMIHASGWHEVNAGVIAVLAAATGIGNLLFYAISRRFS